MAEFVQPKPECSNCQFVLEGNAPLSVTRTYICRRNPPSVLLVGISSGIGGNTPMMLGQFAPTSKDSWCGEYKWNGWTVEA